MTNVLFTADPHVGHERITELVDRPFASVQEMDDALVARWNAVVGVSGLARLSTMNGRKRLVSGNHDACWPGLRNGGNHLPAYLEAGFEAVTPFATTKLPPRAEGRRGRKVLLS